MRQQPLVRVEQTADVLSRLQRAEEEEIAVIRPARDALPSRGARRADDHSRRVEAERVDHVARGEVRRDHDEVGAASVVARESRVVAPDLARRALRPAKEVEVVDRHHLNGVASGQQERVRRVRDVHDAHAERLDRRPFEAVPRQVEQPDGDAAIDDGGRCERTGVDPVLPGAREQHDFVRGAGQRAGELVDVLPDAGAVPQGRPVIQQDAQRVESSMTGRFMDVLG